MRASVAHYSGSEQSKPGCMQNKALFVSFDLGSPRQHILGRTEGKHSDGFTTVVFPLFIQKDPRSKDKVCVRVLVGGGAALSKHWALK